MREQENNHEVTSCLGVRSGTSGSWCNEEAGIRVSPQNVQPLGEFLNQIFINAKLSGNVIVWAESRNSTVRARSGESGVWTRDKEIVVTDEDAAVSAEVPARQLESGNKRRNRRSH